MSSQADDFSSLDASGRLVARIALRPRVTVYALLALLIALTWTLLGLVAIRTANTLPDTLAGPGAGFLRGVGLDWLPAPLERLILLCAAPTPLAAGGLGQFGAHALMWFAMACAMMLPSAAPMVRIYCEIADTARAKGEAVVHPLILVAGYLSVWLAASIVLAGVQALAVTGSAPDMGLSSVVGPVSLAAAGLYQFTGLKNACLEKCRNPFSILFARWSVDPARIFRLGVEQGVFCLGCCWALMLVMVAVGMTNVFWMALIAVFTIVEKQSASRLPQRAAGGILLVWAAGLAIMGG